MSLLRTASRAAVASSVHGRVQRRQQERWAAQPAAPAPAAAAPAPAAPAPAVPEAAPAPALSMDEQLAQLPKLGELRSAGVLTEGEFEIQKARILGL